MFSAAHASHASIATGTDGLASLRAAIAPVRDELLAHPIYRAVDTIPRLRQFMSHHVFAVWDFMCLAKRLQRDLTSLDTLWLPPPRPSLARFINSIVLGEESDVDPDGRAASHFDLYLAAMEEVGAATAPPYRFVLLVRDGVDVETALTVSDASPAVHTFVRQTLQTATQGTTIEVLSSFLFGREDLIPDMFSRLLPLWADSTQARRFTYYVERHIELDGDDHGPAGLRALAEMARDDEAMWETARGAAESAITSRIALWDGVHADILRS
jgi:Protein of unknown function (DUF3050)